MWRSDSLRVAARQVLGALWWAKLGASLQPAALALVLLYASLIPRRAPPLRPTRDKWHACELTPRHLCSSTAAYQTRAHLCRQQQPYGLAAAMKGDVRVAPNGGVIINKGLSTKAWFRAFSTGTVVGGAAGVVGGFALAQAIYSDEHQRDSVRRAVKITGVAVAASMLAGFLASRRR